MNVSRRTNEVEPKFKDNYEENNQW